MASRSSAIVIQKMDCMCRSFMIRMIMIMMKIQTKTAFFEIQISPKQRLPVPNLGQKCSFGCEIWLRELRDGEIRVIPT